MVAALHGPIGEQARLRDHAHIVPRGRARVPLANAAHGIVPVGACASTTVPLQEYQAG